jgi:tetratricopeptide (TPR) repeat protein
MDEKGRKDWRGEYATVLLAHGDYEGAVLELRPLEPASVGTILPLFEQDVRLEDFLDLERMQEVCRRDLEQLPSDPERHGRLGAILYGRGRFEEALAEFRTAHLLGSSRQGWRYPSQQWVERAERSAETARRLEGALANGTSPRNPQETLAFAEVAWRRHLAEPSARWYTRALESEPSLATRNFVLLEAARAALQCGSSQERWRERALEWMREDLALARTRAASGPAEMLRARRTLGAWRTARELECVRGDDAIERLPEAERSGWRGAWASAAELAGELARTRDR